MASLPTVLGVVLIVGLVLLGVGQAVLDTPGSSLAGAATSAEPQRDLNLCMNDCMRGCVTDLADDDPCREECERECGG